MHYLRVRFDGNRRPINVHPLEAEVVSRDTGDARDTEASSAQLGAIEDPLFAQYRDGTRHNQDMRNNHDRP